MQHILTKYGFQRCGIIYVKNGTERIAYQKNLLNSYNRHKSMDEKMFPNVETRFSRLETGVSL